MYVSNEGEGFPYYVYYCSDCNRFTDVRHISDSTQGERPKSQCYRCGEEALKPCEINVVSDRNKKNKLSKKEIYDNFRKLILEDIDKALTTGINKRNDGRIEWVCKHGIGHTIFAPWHHNKTERDAQMVHGCDGCCSPNRKPPICFNCGGNMKQAIDSVTKKKNKHIWECKKCDPERKIRLSIG